MRNAEVSEMEMEEMVWSVVGRMVGRNKVCSLTDERQRGEESAGSNEYSTVLTQSVAAAAATAAR